MEEPGVVAAVAVFVDASKANGVHAPSSEPVWNSKLYGASVVLHAIDATPARWRGDAGSSPLDGAITAA